jgi:hypothetical protein
VVRAEDTVGTNVLYRRHDGDYGLSTAAYPPGVARMFARRRGPSGRASSRTSAIPRGVTRT